MTQLLKIVIPMAGYGSRLRPLTWSKPKPLVPLAGKTVLDHVLGMFRTVPDPDSAEFVFILGPTMGDQIQAHTCKFYPDRHVDYPVQPEMKGQSDAFWQAREHLHGPMLMAFSDTLIDSDFSFLDQEQADIIAWVQPVPDPRRFGVAEVNQSGQVTRLIEKPDDISNNLALVGCYYFRDAQLLLSAIQEQFDRDVSLKGEYYLVEAINILLEQGISMRTETVKTWLDAGTPDALLETNRHLLNNGHNNSEILINTERTHINLPVSIHPQAVIRDATIGPYVSIDEGCVIENCKIENTIIGSGCQINQCQLENSLIGHNVNITGLSGQVILGDDCLVTP